MDIMFTSLLPLFMAMPIELGGLGFTPMAIGYVLGTLGVWTGLFSMLFLARLIHRFGERQLFIVGMLTFTVNFMMLPLINIVARWTGVTWVVWCLLAFSLCLVPITGMCYSKFESKRKGTVLTARQAVYIYSLRHHPRTKIRSALLMASRRRQYQSRGPLVLHWQHRSSHFLSIKIFSEVTQYISSSLHYLARRWFLLYSFHLSYGMRTAINCNKIRYRFGRLVNLLVEETWITKLAEEMYDESWYESLIFERIWQTMNGLRKFMSWDIRKHHVISAIFTLMICLYSTAYFRILTVTGRVSSNCGLQILNWGTLIRVVQHWMMHDKVEIA